MSTEAQETEAQTEEWSDDSTEQELTEARAMGWKPPTEWKGEPPKNGFVKAKEFVERGKTIMPIVQSQLKKEQEKSAKLEDEIDRIKRENEEKFSRLERMSQSALKQQRKQLEEKYEALKENVIETGDKAEYRRLDKEQKDALKEFDDAAEEKKELDKDKPAKSELPSSMKKVIAEWVSENSWFESDEEMNAVANKHHAKLLKEQPGLSLADNLEKVRAYVEKRYPEKFGKDEEDEEDAPKRGSRVEGGSRIPGGGGGKSAWSRIPKEAQTAADRFIKENGLFLQKGESVEKDMNKARERYAKEYLGDEA